MSYYFKSYGVILAHSPKWANEAHGFAVNGIGDCIFRTCIHAISVFKENPEESYNLLRTCAWLLESGNRWPNELNPPASTKYRSQKSMTRDPYIMFYTACFVTENTELMINIDVPFMLFRSYVINFRDWIFSNDPGSSRERFIRQVSRLIWWGEHTEAIATFFHNRKWFIRGLRHKFGIHGYSLHLWTWMAYVTKSKVLRDSIYEHLDISNLLCLKLLDGDTNLINNKCFIYRAKEGYQWGDNRYIDKKLLDPSDSIRIDRQILDYSLSDHIPV